MQTRPNKTQNTASGITSKSNVIICSFRLSVLLGCAGKYYTTLPGSTSLNRTLYINAEKDIIKFFLRQGNDAHVLDVLLGSADANCASIKFNLCLLI